MVVRHMSIVLVVKRHTVHPNA